MAAETAPGPFNAAGMSTEMLAILPRLAAAFNRSTLLIDSGQPDGEKRADYYTNAITNHYDHDRWARVRIPVRRRGPAGALAQSGAVSDPARALVTMTRGTAR